MAENRTYIVPDSSVLIQWALDFESNAGAEATTGTEGNMDTKINTGTKALQIQDDAVAGKLHLVVPSHCLYEVTNTLGRLITAEAHTFMSYLISSGLVEEAPLSAELAQCALALVTKYPPPHSGVGSGDKSLSLYDATYHALALILKGTFVTTNAKYFALAQAEGAIELA